MQCASSDFHFDDDADERARAPSSNLRARRAEARVGQRGGVGWGIRAGKPVRRATRATSRSKGGGEAGDRRSPRGGTESDEPPTPPPLRPFRRRPGRPI